MTDPIAWKNGSRLRFCDLQLPVWDLGVVAGASITEMARTYRHRPFRLENHVSRLVESCDEIGFALPFPTGEILEATESIVKTNCGLIEKSDDLGIVIFVTAGGNPTYLGTRDVPAPSVVIHTFRLPLELWRPSAEDGVRLTIPSVKQIPEDSLPVHRKTRNRLHWWIADRQAAKVERGSRALLLDHAGHLTETSTSCFYGVIDGRIVTARSGVLDSMSCRLVEELADSLQIPFSHTDIRTDDIPKMTEAFVSSTPVGIFHVASIDGKTIGDGVPGPVCRQLREAWAKVTELNPTNQILAAAPE